MIGAAMALVLLAQGPTLETHRFVLTGSGRFAVFADLASIVRDGDAVTMRAFQVVEPGFTAAGNPYWGGWSRWSFDCAAMTADRLDFASVREGGLEGPATLDPQPPYAAAPGGDAAELLAVGCGDAARTADVTTLQDAVTLGRTTLVPATVSPPRPDRPAVAQRRGWRRTAPPRSLPQASPDRTIAAGSPPPSARP